MKGTKLWNTASKWRWLCHNAGQSIVNMLKLDKVSVPDTWQKWIAIIETAGHNLDRPLYLSIWERLTLSLCLPRLWIWRSAMREDDGFKLQCQVEMINCPLKDAATGHCELSTCAGNVSSIHVSCREHKSRTITGILGWGRSSLKVLPLDLVTQIAVLWSRSHCWIIEM